MKDYTEMSLDELAYAVESDDTEAEPVMAELWRRREDLEVEVRETKDELDYAAGEHQCAVDEREKMYKMLGELDGDRLDDFFAGREEAAFWANHDGMDYDQQ